MSENNNKIWTFIKNNWKDTLIIFSIIIIIILIMPTTCTNRKNENLTNNIKALTDSVQTLNLKNGELLSAKQSLILEKKELEKYLDISKKDVNDLEKKLNSSLALIAKLNGGIHVDTIMMTDSVIIHNDTIDSYFNYTDKWICLDGHTSLLNNYATTTINNISMSADLKMGMTDDYKVFVTTDNPYLTFNEIDAAAIDGSVVREKKKRWNIGAQLGIGAGYNLASKTDKFFIGPYIGVGISYGFDF